MFSKSLNWMRRHMKSVRFAALLSFVALIIAFGVVQASGPMRPRPPMKPGGMGMWGHVRNIWYPAEPVPTMTITAVVEDESVTFETANFPEDEDFTVTMGEMYTRGINGIEVGEFNSGDGGTLEQTFDIPDDLEGAYRISIRAQTDHTFPYYAFNWFYNNSTETEADEDEAEVEEGEEAEVEEGEEAEVEEGEEAEVEEGEEAEVAEGEEAEAAEGEEAEAEEGEEAEAAEGEEAAAEEGELALTAQPWIWVEFTDPVQGTQEIEAPEIYEVTFLEDGALLVNSDCNSGTGFYTEDAGTLSISIPSPTEAICQDGSLSTDFFNNLESAAVFFFEEGNLYIDLFADAGTMQFEAAAEEAAEPGTGGAAETEEAAEELPSIAEIAGGDPQFSTLVTALDAAGLVETLTGEGEFTVFAPVNDAFDALPEGTLDALLADAEGDLTNVLLYHVVDGVVLAEDVVALDSADTLLGEAIAISVVDDTVVLNDTVQVTLTDVEASNGVVHVIDGVLIPPSMSEAEEAEGAEAETEEMAEETEGAEADTEEAEGEEAAEELPSIAEIAGSDPQFSTLVTALDAAGLVDTFAGEGEFTVFAPVNDAFDALPEGTLDALLADAEGDLTNVLLYHVVDGVVLAEDVVALDSADTLLGEAIAISVVDDTVTLNESVAVTLADVEASNGVIHVIDGVLIPPSMSEAEEAEGAEAETEEAETEESEETAMAPEAEAGDTGLVGLWQWAEFTDPVEGPVTIEEPEKYTVEFLTDGTLSVQADCNGGSGSFSVEGENITVDEPMAMQQALCEEGSKSDDFVMFLVTAETFSFADGNLHLNLPEDGGSMMFVPAESEETSSFVRSAAMKVAAQNGDDDEEEDDEDAVPSFEVCTVVADETVAVVTADFPEGEEFDVTMGPVLVAKPMKPKYGPMPMPMPDYMPAYPPMNDPYKMGASMDPMYNGPGMGDKYNGPGMGDMYNGPGMDDMYMGPPGKGPMDMGMGYKDMWGKPMPPKVYVPFYYDVESFESDGGSLELEFDIPDELAGYYRIQIMMRTDHQYPYYAYNWFYNNDAEVCDDNGDNGDNDNG